MSREILFRAKGLYKDCWYYGDFVKCYRHMTYQIIDLDEQEMKLGHYVKPDTLGQFTGLTDKNGTKIFEGDIIKIPEDWDKYGINAGELFEVYFTDGGFRLKPKIYKDCRGFWLEDDGEFEIISNIHDNPKLLKED